LGSELNTSSTPAPTVFLSYASEDRQAARLIGDALPAYGLEVWYDESELGGGDAWDQKIRRQIRECDYFMALVSAHTESRHEGYFRREWRLAVERTLDMADDHLFLLPIVIDDTNEAGARVPEKFLTVQWLRVPGGRPTPALEALCRRIVSGGAAPPAPSKRSPAPALRTVSPAASSALPEFPRQEPGQKFKFWVAVVGWALRSIWALYKRLPRWVRWLLIMWLVVLLLQRGCTPRHHESSELSPEAAKKLNTIAEQYKGNTNGADVAKLAAQFAHEFADDAKGTGQRSAVLAMPFGAPAGDAAAAKLADSTFAQVYGRVAVSHHGHVGMTNEPVSSCDLAVLLQRGREKRAEFVLCGAIGAEGSVQVLSISIASMEESKVLWSKAYPLAGADPAKIASDVDSNVPAIDDD
jgi:TolB-like protein